MLESNTNSLVPDGITKTLVCIDEVKNNDFSGRLINLYMPQAVEFHSSTEMIFAMESFFDDIGYPQTSYSLRSFWGEKKQTAHVKDLVKYMEETAFTNNSGQKLTLMFQVQQRQNATWQGILVENNKQHSFKCMLELLMIILSFLEKQGDVNISDLWDNTK